MNQLFEKALNIREPFFIDSVEFNVEQKRLDIRIDFHKGAEFTVNFPDGRSIQGKAYDTVEKTWRHLNFFEHECYLHARVPRVKHENGINQVETPWEGIANGFTLLFEALMIAMCLSMPVYKVSQILNVSDDKIWRTLKEYVLRTLHLSDYSDIEAVGIDETSRAKGHDYITLFVDLMKRRTVFVADGKGSETVEEFVSMLEQQNGEVEKIKEVSCDMSPAFIKGIKDNLKEASITFDRFHTMKFLTEAVDEVRKMENREEGSLKRLRYLFLKNEDNLNQEEKLTLEGLRLSGLGKKTLKAHQIKENFRLAYNAESISVFEQYLKKWYYAATHSRLGPMIKAAKTIKTHWDGIVRWKKTGWNNGILEGLNSLVQAAKARARGYASNDNFKTIVFLLTGKLDFKKLNPCCLPT